MRTASQAVAQARRYRSVRVGMCLYYVQEWFGAPHRFPDAISQWHHTGQHGGTPAYGTPVFYAGGRHGHIAISIGDGKIISTDAPSNGRVGVVDLHWPTRRWGHQYVGWGDTLGGAHIPGVHEQHRHTGAPTYLGKLQFGQRDSDSVRNLQRALNAHKMAGGHNLPVTGYYGPATDQEVRLCQKLHNLGHDPARGSNVGPQQAKHLGLPDVRR